MSGKTKLHVSHFSCIPMVTVSFGGCQGFNFFNPNESEIENFDVKRMEKSKKYC